MFNCEVCEQTTPPGTKLWRIPEGYRETDYPHRNEVFETSVSYKKKRVTRDDPGGEGYELEGIVKACPSCYEKWEEEMAAQMLPEGVSPPDAMATDPEELREAA